MLGLVDFEGFFTAALTPGRWPATLDDLARSLGVAGATITAGPSSANSIVHSMSLDGIMHDYLSGGIALDSREARVQPKLSEGFIGDHDSFSVAEIKHDPFYAEFLRPRGLGWHAAARLAGGARPVVLSLKRRMEQGPFERTELQAMSRALAHLRMASRMAEIALTARSNDLLQALSDRGIGGALLDQRGRVLHHNRLLPHADGLAIKQGHIVTGFSTDQPPLDRIIGIATSRLPIEDLPPDGAVLVHRPSGGAPLLVRITRLVEPQSQFLARACALLQVSDPEHVALPAGNILSSLYDLTPRETELALELARGTSLGFAAERVGISYGHARQRLKTIFAKLGIRRQAELAPMIQRLA